jgi:hypothetical protein
MEHEELVQAVEELRAMTHAYGIALRALVATNPAALQVIAQHAQLAPERAQALPMTDRQIAVFSVTLQALAGIQPKL